MKKYVSVCEGCKSKYISGETILCRAGLTPTKSNNSKCPCSICLVKAMCDEVCEKIIGEKNPYKTYTFKDRKESYIRTVLGYTYK